MSDKIDDGGPAFPSMTKRDWQFPSMTKGDWHPADAGMTLRDYFAALTLSSLPPGWFENQETSARWCFEMADAMLKARKAQK